MDGLLFEIADKSVDDSGRQKVCDEEAVEEDALCPDDHHLHEPARFAHLHERQQMHSLIVALLEECLDPAVVTLHAPEATEMSEHTANHARNASNALKKDKADKL